jgi:hypothetical protein
MTRPPTSRCIEVHTLAPAARRMLLEMLASERSGEEALHVGELFDRDRIALELCALEMSRWVSLDHVVFTEYGRHVAEALAARLVDREHAVSC